MGINYCEQCSKEILDPKNKLQFDHAIILALAQMAGAIVSPKPEYCQCVYKKLSPTPPNGEGK